MGIFRCLDGYSGLRCEDYPMPWREAAIALAAILGAIIIFSFIFFIIYVKRVKHRKNSYRPNPVDGPVVPTAFSIASAHQKVMHKFCLIMRVKPEVNYCL